MPRTSYVTATSLDGFIATDDHSLEWLFAATIEPGGPFDHDTFMAGVGAAVMGRSTYDWLVHHLADSGEPWPYTIPCWVLTHRSADPLPGADVRFAAQDVTELHPAMLASAAGRDLWVVGGGDIAGRLAVAGLLDEVVVSIAPVTLGSGAPLLPHRVDLRLEDTGRNVDFVCARFAVVPPAPHGVSHLTSADPA
ncbi:hypothetical protein HMPREF0063_11729 [Aeromicrobium marinum DSM 15272]|uniref:Bacterial bifunctional deaminase-reductase C-terminal domain-containing protein n=1 Tax=Aeromicrobium marinum DSM 15272 TaxID=585531 RepID=E2SDE3_9ACTN|nr:dihydrofolate reductase family protein [Aeromicrobium marinum]EFQ82520.1 hypothetical protein HMPREF0063_11729 [Aeromicrobium marinum DSM 15272]